MHDNDSLLSYFTGNFFLCDMGRTAFTRICSFAALDWRQRFKSHVFVAEQLE